MTFTLKTFNEIAPEGLSILKEHGISVNTTEMPDAFLLRSYDLHSFALPDSLLAIGRAGAGTNNIPVDIAAESGIVVFNAPGANANAVKELVLASLLLSVRPILSGVHWLKHLKNEMPEEAVEQHKKQFVGHELVGKTLGVIGLGAIGSMVANDAYRLGMNVIGYDPYISVETAWNISRRVKHAKSLDEVLAHADFLTVHAPLNDATRNLINHETLQKMKPSSVLLNFARRELVDTDAVIQALDSGLLLRYFSDFVDTKLLNHPQAVLTPHLGASTYEAEVNCAVMVSQTLAYFLKTGDIRHSVNFPTVELNFVSQNRFTFIHRNIPNMLGQISSCAAQHNLNIENMVNRSHDDFAYTIMDTHSIEDADLPMILNDFQKIDAMIRVRHIPQSDIHSF